VQRGPPLCPLPVASNTMRVATCPARAGSSEGQDAWLPALLICLHAMLPTHLSGGRESEHGHIRSEQVGGQVGVLPTSLSVLPQGMRTQ
jgi:hypothetical protein